ncbi:MAG TPA: DUF4286 family protein [Puia sp.]|nr:DUF4286 family protein [Puia sp.]
MLAFNVTIKVNWSIADAWIEWLCKEHIPEVMATKLFDEYRIYRLLEQDDEEGPTYTIQYFTSSQERYLIYMQSYAMPLRQKALDKWGDLFIAHRSIMQLVD